MSDAGDDVGEAWRTSLTRYYTHLLLTPVELTAGKRGECCGCRRRAPGKWDSSSQVTPMGPQVAQPRRFMC
jgi:hypothetical protein